MTKYKINTDLVSSTEIRLTSSVNRAKTSSLGTSKSLSSYAASITYFPTISLLQAHLLWIFISCLQLCVLAWLIFYAYAIHYICYTEYYVSLLQIYRPIWLTFYSVVIVVITSFLLETIIIYYYFNSMFSKNYLQQKSIKNLTKNINNLSTRFKNRFKNLGGLLCTIFPFTLPTKLSVYTFHFVSDYGMFGVFGQNHEIILIISKYLEIFAVTTQFYLMSNRITNYSVHIFINFFLFSNIFGTTCIIHRPTSSIKLVYERRLYLMCWTLLLNFVWVSVVPVIIISPYFYYFVEDVPPEYNDKDFSVAVLIGVQFFISSFIDLGSKLLPFLLLFYNVRCFVVLLSKLQIVGRKKKKPHKYRSLVKLARLVNKIHDTKETESSTLILQSRLTQSNKFDSQKNQSFSDTRDISLLTNSKFVDSNNNLAYWRNLMLNSNKFESVKLNTRGKIAPLNGARTHDTNNSMKISNQSTKTYDAQYGLLKKHVQLKVRKFIFYSTYLFILWGLNVIAISVFSLTYSACKIPCKLQAPVWFQSKKCPCSVAEISCYQKNIGRELTTNEMNSVFDEMLPKAMTFLIISHCSNFTVPQNINIFSGLIDLQFYNVSLYEWSKETAIYESVFPRLSVLEMVIFTFKDASLPEALLIDDISPILIDVELTVTNLGSLPDDIDYKWRNFNFLFLEHSKFTEFPMKLLNIAFLQELYISYNYISVVPDDLFVKLPYLDSLFLLGNYNLTEFPSIIDPSYISVLLNLYCDYTNISDFYDIDKIHVFKRLSLTNTPYCRKAGNSTHGCTSPDNGYYLNGRYPVEVVAAQRNKIT